MRQLALKVGVGLLAVLPALRLFAADDPPSPPLISCGNGVPGGIHCVATAKERRQAREAFERGLKLQERKELDKAFVQFDQASRLMPEDPQFLSARELAKAQIVFSHLERGNFLLYQNSAKDAIAEFRSAIELDPDNGYARERLKEATLESSPALPTTLPVQPTFGGEIRLEPKPDLATFHYRGDVRGMFNEIATAYGITAQFDESVSTRQVRLYLDNVDFFTAIRLATEISKTMWTAVDTHHMLIAADTPENHKQFDRFSLQTFQLPPHSTPQEATELVTTLRTVFDLRFINSGQTADTLEVRAPQPILEATAKLLQQLDNQRPQVMFDIQVFQINHQLTRNIGLHIPNTFNMYNIPAAALAGLGGGANIQDLINQLISSGGINAAGSSALSGLLAQLGGQQNSIFSQPLATFGGGLTFMGLSLDQLSAALSVNESWVRSLESMNLRASQGNEATFHLGTRFPILNASYAPIYNSPQISAVLGNQSYIPPFPSVSYEDLGLNVKAKPTVHRDGSVSLQLELQVRSLTGQSANGVPVISNREYKGSINLKDGEPAVVAGEVSQNDTLSMSGIPGLGYIPLLNQAMVNNTKQSETDELMIVMTPHVLSMINANTPEIWISEK